jgi:hypothetical protein
VSYWQKKNKFTTYVAFTPVLGCATDKHGIPVNVAVVGHDILPLEPLLAPSDLFILAIAA